MADGTSAFAQASCDLGAPAEGMPDEFAQFAFIIGDFDVNYRQWVDGDWSEPLGQARWNGRYTLNGRAIMDWWYEGDADSPAGINIRLFDPNEGLWKTAWHYTANYEVRELRQRIWEEDGRLHLWQVYPEAPERNVYFETYEDGRWARVDQRMNEETGEWEPAIMLEAIPASCVPRP
jgi:hypothetical protein